MGTPAIIGVLMVLALTGCHQDMYDQPKVKPLTESRFYRDGIASRPLAEGTVARGYARTDELLYTGKLNGKQADEFPFPVTEEVMKRGQDRFNIYCSPCHGRLGNGKGMIVQRGFPQPRSFHIDSLKEAPAGYFFDVMTNGFGRMYSYAPSVPVHDRWAIIAYIRALQLSQSVPVARLTDAERSRLSEGGRQ
jgi:hypothetical protein